MKLPHIIALVGAGAVILGAAALGAGGTIYGKPATATANAPAIAVPQRHTLADMLALADGISYDDAARSLGTLGHAVTRRSAGIPGLEDDDTVEVYAWPNPDGSRVVLVFRDDRLVHRAQVGLR
ncbi:MAG: hypothetical protein ACK4TL_04135 [Hyphomicrobiaceae bacterium]